MKIEIEGVQYKVVENLGYQGGFIAKAVQTEEGEKIAVKRSSGWHFWTASNRVGKEGK